MVRLSNLFARVSSLIGNQEILVIIIIPKKIAPNFSTSIFSVLSRLHRPVVDRYISPLICENENGRSEDIEAIGDQDDVALLNAEPDLPTAAEILGVDDHRYH